MSDAEARERRRNKILASKQDRMSRILGAHNGSSTDDLSTTESPVQEEKLVHKPKETKTKSTEKTIESQPSKKTETVKKVENKVKAEDKNIELGAESVQIGSNRSSRRIHLLAVVIAALFCVVLATFSVHPLCQANLGSPLCGHIQNNLYALTVSVFCLVETEEFLFGRLSKANGAPVDPSLLGKDLALFILLIILAANFSQKYL